MTDTPKPPKVAKSKSDAAAARSAAALRDNLLKRKAQARARDTVSERPAGPPKTGSSA